jgi:hypothetical protein
MLETGLISPRSYTINNNEISNNIKEIELNFDNGIYECKIVFKNDAIEYWHFAIEKITKNGNTNKGILKNINIEGTDGILYIDDKAYGTIETYFGNWQNVILNITMHIYQNIYSYKIEWEGHPYKIITNN